jgi:murein DD-endopeptidase MepM/ murein hydrolase activator NlpD
MWWRALITVLLVSILAAVLWRRGDLPIPLLPQETPHEAYARGLRDAGLADSAIGRAWLAAADAALQQPDAATPPVTRVIEHDAASVRAYAYRFDLRRGRVLTVELDLQSESPAHVFIDLFRLTDGEPPKRVASAERDARAFTHEITRDGTYVLRLQPELLEGGTLRIAQRTTAALTFPVEGRDSRAVGSYFRDPRDGGARDHHGVDIFAPHDTPVLAAADGIVSSVNTTNRGGNVVWVWDSARGQSHYYAHLSRQAVHVGQRVKAGEVVGYVGNTGNARSTPPHLHFGIYAFREGPIDPLPFVARPGSTSTKPAQRTTGNGGYRGNRESADDSLQR